MEGSLPSVIPEFGHTTTVAPFSAATITRRGRFPVARTTGRWCRCGANLTKPHGEAMTIAPSPSRTPYPAISCFGDQPPPGTPHWLSSCPARCQNGRTPGIGGNTISGTGRSPHVGHVMSLKKDPSALGRKRWEVVPHVQPVRTPFPDVAAYVMQPISVGADVVDRGGAEVPVSSGIASGELTLEDVHLGMARFERGRPTETASRSSPPGRRSPPRPPSAGESLVQAQ